MATLQLGCPSWTAWDAGRMCGQLLRHRLVPLWVVLGRAVPWRGDAEVAVQSQAGKVPEANQRRWGASQPGASGTASLAHAATATADLIVTVTAVTAAAAAAVAAAGMAASHGVPCCAHGLHRGHAWEH